MNVNKSTLIELMEKFAKLKNESEFIEQTMIDDVKNILKELDFFNKFKIIDNFESNNYILLNQEIYDELECDCESYNDFNISVLSKSIDADIIFTFDYDYYEKNIENDDSWLRCNIIIVTFYANRLVMKFYHIDYYDEDVVIFDIDIKNDIEESIRNVLLSNITEINDFEKLLEKCKLKCESENAEEELNDTEERLSDLEEQINRLNLKKQQLIGKRNVKNL
jgi:DNA-binding protein H-NS